MIEPIISVSGLRGIIGESLTPEFAVRYVAAFASELAAGPVVVTRDGRDSGEMLSDAVRCALQATGRVVMNAHVTATPTTGVLVRSVKAAGGVQISASHNPPAYNGLKLLDVRGRVIGSRAGQHVMERFRNGQIDWVSHGKLGTSRELTDSTSEHLSLLLKTVDVWQIRRRRFKVVLDSNHGAGAILGGRLLEQLGCEVVILGEQPNGRFAHPPEPTAENLAGVCEIICGQGADIGFCQDPDADRLAVIDEAGRYIGEEYTLALCLDHVLQTRKGPVVTNCASSRMSQDIANKHGVSLFRSAVGEANVVELMLDKGAVFGGEGNGGPIDPRVGYIRDSFVGMVQILDALAAQQCKVSQLADQLPRYQIHKAKVSLPREKIPPLLESLKTVFCDAKPNQMDGLRLDWDDCWLLVRASNTEPIVRIIAEAASSQQALAIINQAAEILSD